MPLFICKVTPLLILRVPPELIANWSIESEAVMVIVCPSEMETALSDTFGTAGAG